MLWLNLILTILLLVWDPIGATLSNRIQTLQNRAARVILGYRNEHGQPEAALSDLGWKIFKECRLIMKARLMYKITHSQAPVALTEIFENSQQIYNLRNNEFKLYLPKPNTEYLKKSIGFCGAKLWNELSGNLRTADGLNSFNTLIADTSLLYINCTLCYNIYFVVCVMLRLFMYLI